MSETEANQATDEANILYQAHPAMAKNGPLAFTIGIILIPVFGIGILVLLSQYAKCKQTEVTVTDQETIVRRGVLSRSHLDVRHANVRSAYVERSLSDRLFGVGTISLYTSGDEPEVTVRGIPDPLKVRQIIKDHADL
jgi:uncharacterized membrane protein YdbT with pleckstrin-like domain